MVIFTAGNGIWEIHVRAEGKSVQFEEAGRGAYRLVDAEPATLAAGEFTCQPIEEDPVGATLKVFFRPFDSLNPNLDSATYRILEDGRCLARKLPRQDAPAPAPGAALDMRQDARLWDFAQDFWRNRAAELWPIDQPGRTAINLAIGNTAAGSTMNSLENSGWPVMYLGMSPEIVLRAMQALSVSADQFSAPQYPQLGYVHIWAQAGAVIPGAAYFTMLRDPIRRLVSLYSWRKDQGMTDLEMDACMEEWCQGFPNFQLYWLANIGGPVQYSLMPMFCNPEFIHVNKDGMVMTDTLLSCAEQSLDKFFFVGMSDQFDHSLALISLLTRSPTIGRWKHLFRSSASDGYTLSPAVRARMERVFAPELAFYERQRTLFFDRYRDELKFLGEHLPSLALA